MSAARLAWTCWLAVWELPQNLLGAALFGLLRVTGAAVGWQRSQGRLVVETRGLGVSLGWFVFWTRTFADGFAGDCQCRRHELGHGVQSRWFGPLYLLLVGVPSVSRVIYSQLYWRVHKRPWLHYYDGWPELQADRLGGVDRDARRRAWQAAGLDSGGGPS